MVDSLPIVPFTRPVRGRVMLPGSKSLTNRALVLGALGEAPVTLTHALLSRDTRLMAGALRELGFSVDTNEPERTIRIVGRGGEIPQREAYLDVGNAGTVARFLTALVCLRAGGVYHFSGDEAMSRRPIAALLDALATQGAQATAKSFPFTLRTAGLPGGEVQLDASESSQLISALLLAGSRARTPLRVRVTGETVSRPFVEMTERMVAQFSAKPANYAIEPDATAASYFLALPLVAGGRLTLAGLATEGSLQGDIAFVTVLRSAGLSATAGDRGEEALVAPGISGRGVAANFNAFSDTFLTLAAIAPLLEGPTRITGIAHTRKQETDRVAGAARELRRLGQDVIEEEDALTITPRPLVSDVEIETYGDHRFAMSFAILGCHDLHGNGRPWLWIRNPDCCAKTFPDFFGVLELLWKDSHLCS